LIQSNTFYVDGLLRAVCYARVFRICPKIIPSGKEKKDGKEKKGEEERERKGKGNECGKKRKEANMTRQE
jgi:hypothetical protein